VVNLIANLTSLRQRFTEHYRVLRIKHGYQEKFFSAAFASERLC